MVGTAWLVVMDDLLKRGGPLGAILGFSAGALMLLPIGYVYGKLVKMIPEASGEVAYTARVFPTAVSFVTGSMMFLAYFLTCPFEALAAGRITGYLFPSFKHLGTLSSRKSSRLSASYRFGACHYGVFYLAELSGNSRQRQVFKNHDVYLSCVGHPVCFRRCKTRQCA
jgi:amino acid transporter